MELDGVGRGKNKRDATPTQSRKQGDYVLVEKKSLARQSLVEEYHSRRPDQRLRETEALQKARRKTAHAPTRMNQQADFPQRRLDLGGAVRGGEIVKRRVILERFPDGASPPGMLAGMQSAGGRSLQAAD